MSGHNDRAFGIRKWEAVNQPPFISVIGAGGNLVEITLPKGYIYGSYIHLRDVLFMYGNTYDSLSFRFIEVTGNKSKDVYITSYIKGTPQGKAAFIDRVIRPRFNTRYYYQLDELPRIPEEYGLFHKLHYRVVTIAELEKGRIEYADFYLKCLIDMNPAPSFMNEPESKPSPIYKYVCYVCKNMFDLKLLYTFALDNKKHHICHHCYDDIPLTSMERIELKRV